MTMPNGEMCLVRAPQRNDQWLMPRKQENYGVEGS
jgi:hypothetical protein